MEVWAKKAYHYEKPVPAKGEGSAYQMKDFEEVRTVSSLVNNYLCMGKQSPCVIGTCDVMCGYGRMYIQKTAGK